MLAPHTLLNGRYQIDRPVGEGGMATVYRAVDTRLGRTVAVKVLHSFYANDAPFLQRFQQEAEFAASLGAHPNIVDIYDIGQDGDLHYLVMEFIEGPSLKELISERGRFPISDAFSIGAQVASALSFAHGRGLVHRDIKPQNILVTPDGVAKVTDFGIARSSAASQLTRTGMVIGTAHYLSPEQAMGRGAEAGSDIYSLGVILYEMVTGHLPFDADNPIGVAMQHVHSEPPSPWDYVPTLPAAVVSIIMRALAKDSAARFASASELEGALRSQITPHTGDTTVFGPIGPAAQPTVVMPTVDPTPPGRPLGRERAVYRPPARALPAQRETVRSNNRSLWMALGAVLLLLAVALGAYFMTTNALGGGPTPTPTPTTTPTPTPKPKPKHRPTATPTSAPVVVVVPTTPPQPTSTPTPSPAPTAAPTPTPTPKPVPTPTTPPQPTPTPTPQPVPASPIPLVTATAVG